MAKKSKKKTKAQSAPSGTEDLPTTSPTTALVWAFEPLAELDNATGFVHCDLKLAEELIEADRVDNPRIGASNFRFIKAPGDKPSRKAAPVMKVQKPEKTSTPEIPELEG